MPTNGADDQQRDTTAAAAPEPDSPPPTAPRLAQPELAALRERLDELSKALAEAERTSRREHAVIAEAGPVAEAAPPDVAPPVPAGLAEPGPPAGGPGTTPSGDQFLQEPPGSAPPGVTLTRKLAVFSDGTGNSSAKAEKTNVWRLFQAVDQTSPDQLAKYDDGVGTSRNPYLAAIGGAFGWGLKANVLDLYKFICRNYRKGDAIYAFGFSRGAYTIRCLVELLDTQGVLTDFGSEAELDRLARMAYRDFRFKRMKVREFSPVHIYRAIRNLWDRTASFITRQPAKAPQGQAVPIEFLGLWDTVSAYGMPIKELRPSVAWLLWPMEFKDHVLPPGVKRCCHALSLDDERATFHPILYNSHPNLSQVWFAGVHSNLGGGYPEDQLSLVSLNWMMDQLQALPIHPARQLRIRREAIEAVSKAQSPFAKLYDSRAGISILYRYSPRVFGHVARKQANPVLPVIHHSVLTRMAKGSDSYVPSVLPHDFEVLAPDGKQTMSLATAMQSLATAPAGGKPQPLLRKPCGPSLDLVLDTVWWRRVAYVATYGLALAALLFPWYAKPLHALLVAGQNMDAGVTFAGSVRTICFLIVQFDAALASFIVPRAELIGRFGPDFLLDVLKPIASHPLELAAVVLPLWASYRKTNALQVELRDLARLAWDASREAPFREARRAKAEADRNVGLALLVLLNVTAGYIALFAFPKAATIEFGAFIVVINALAVRQALARQRLMRELDDKAFPVFRVLKGGGMAKAFRTNHHLQKAGRWLRNFALPCAFTLALLYALAIPANKLAYEVTSTFGAWCRPAPQAAVAQPLTFDIKNFCWASGVQLEKGVRYEVTLQANGPWKDRDVPASPAGLANTSLRYAMAAPFKRNWGAGWMQPIARVGGWGTEEYAFKPCAPAAGATACATASFTAQRSAQLYLFVNDAVLMLPGLRTFFSDNNSGHATITIMRSQP